jgi:hypothetical protein
MDASRFIGKRSQAMWLLTDDGRFREIRLLISATSMRVEP